MATMRRRFGLLALLAFEGSSVTILHRLGEIEWMQIPWSELGTWLAAGPVEDLLAAMLRVIALVLAYWMLGSTVLYLVTRLIRIPAAVRSVEWTTFPAVRRVVDGAIAVSIATASMAVPMAPALADGPPPVVIETDDAGRPVPPGAPTDDRSETDHDAQPAGLGRIGWVLSPAEPASDAPSDPEPVARPPGFASATQTAASVIVEPGDHLWSISRRHLETVDTADVSNDEVGSYWRRVIAANRERLRSGDPDLIYPGEAVVLPPVDTEDEG